MTLPLRDKLGLCQWFHFEDYASIQRVLELAEVLNLRHLRTGISWADYYRPGGPEWYDRQMRMLHEAGLEVLLCVWHVPPSISESGTCAGPPRRLRNYADFIDLVITRYGDQFADLELWNEPNNYYKWAFPTHDPDWAKFGRMIRDAAYWAHQRGRRTVLGGMIPVDHHWLRLIESYGALEHIDVVAIHGFPGMWWSDAPNWDWYSHWKGWDDRIAYIAAHAGGRAIWVTETGLATCDLETRQPARHDVQVAFLEQAAAAPAERIYWYSLIDLDPEREAIEGFHVDENEYHLGLVTHDGARKPAFWRFQELLAGTGHEAGPRRAARVPGA